MSKVIYSNPTITQEQLIDRLNPKIRGWANYHRHINAKKRWINKKYYHHAGERNWIFAALSDDGKLKELLRAADNGNKSTVHPNCHNKIHFQSDQIAVPANSM